MILVLLWAFNSLVLYFVSSIFVALFFNTYAHSHADLLNWLLPVASSLVVLSLALLFNSSAGEWMLRLSFGARKPIQREKNKLHPIIERVQDAVETKLKKKRIPVHLMVVDESFPNAFALGKSTIIITRAQYEKSTDDEIAGVLAHEFGHLHNGDSNKLGMVFGMNLVTMMISMVAGFFAMIIGGFKALGRVTRGDAGLFMLFAGFMIGSFVWFFKLFVNGGHWLLRLGMLFVGRKQEYRADAFAVQIGFGEGLLSDFEKIKDQSYETPKTLIGRLYDTHPAIMLRIGEIEKLLSEQVVEVNHSVVFTELA
jgi:heat shock protein HtpX